MSAQPIHFHVDYEHLGRVLAERQRVGPGYIYDVRERAKARRRQRERCAR